MTKEKQKTNRPPIITIMGHVDHGKTTLMDHIKKTHIADKEAGGITQGIRAFSYSYKGKLMTFIDTPGHEAFTKMRERGSTISDIILLVVAADDGVKPQTKEVINLALHEKTPMIVAINKVDLPNADVTKVKTELATAGVMLEGWGGDTVSIEISAKTGQGVDALLDMIMLVADLEDLHEDPSQNTGIVLESYMTKTTGPESQVIIKSGSFEIGDFVIGDKSYGKVRALINDEGERVKKADVSTPIRILGLSTVLQSGEMIIGGKDKVKLEEIMSNKVTAIVDDGLDTVEINEIEKTPIELLDALMNQSKAADKKPVLNIVLKADVVGSIEAIKNSLENAANDAVDMRLIRTGTGEITESDVLFAKSTRAVVIGFNAQISPRIQTLASRERVIIMNYKIIYELVDDVVTAAESMIPPEIVEVYIGSGEIIDVFKLSNGSYVAGTIVKDGKVVRGYNCYVTRGGERVYEGKITSIRHFKDEVKEAAKGVECGISTLPSFEFLKGDKITCIRIEKS